MSVFTRLFQSHKSLYDAAWTCQFPSGCSLLKTRLQDHIFVNAFVQLPGVMNGMSLGDDMAFATHGPCHSGVIDKQGERVAESAGVLWLS